MKINRPTNIIIIPDSFKGTLTAIECCDIMARAIQDQDPNARITKIPMADGGEGTCQAFHCAMGGELISCQVSGPYLEPKDAIYWRNDQTAVVELAAAAGFIADAGRRNPSATSTYGVGQLIIHAIRGGCKKIILGLGGSSTNDAGLGIAAALGARFMDESDREFIPTGGSMARIDHMDLSGLREATQGVQFEVMCDVDNPLYGSQGAAYVFAPQKGADPPMVEMLDQNLRAFANLIRNQLGINVSNIPGGGAAGGAGAGAYVFLDARLRPGAQIVLEMNRFDDRLKEADLVITGEGSLDTQSLHGKVVVTVSDHAKAGRVPVVAIVGTTKGDISRIYEHGVIQVVRSIDQCQDPDHYEKTCKQDLYNAVAKWFLGL